MVPVENYKLKTFRCLKIKFEANKFTQGNVFIIDLFKVFLELKVCEGAEDSLIPPGATVLMIVVKVNVKNQWSTVYAKNILFGILLLVFVSVM